MAVEQFANNAQSTLASAITAGATSLTVASALAFPTSPQFRILVDSEIMLVTAVSGNTFTVTRAAEAVGGVQQAAAHLASTYVTHIITAGALANLARTDAANTFTVAPQQVTIDSAGHKGLIVKAASSQSASLQEWQDSSGAVVAGMGNLGQAGIGAAPLTGSPPSATLYVKQVGSGTPDAVMQIHATNHTINYGPFSLYNDTYSSSVPVAYYFGFNHGDCSFGNASSNGLYFSAGNYYRDPSILIHGGTEQVVLTDGGIHINSSQFSPPVSTVPVTHYSLSHNTSSVWVVTAHAHAPISTGSDGVGVGEAFYCRTSTGTLRQVAEIDAIWATATDASRKGRLAFSIYDSSAAREGLRIETDGSQALLGFYGATAVAQPTVSGTRTGTLGQLQTVVQNLLAALASQGLIIDTTT